MRVAAGVIAWKGEHARGAGPSRGTLRGHTHERRLGSPEINGSETALPNRSLRTAHSRCRGRRIHSPKLYRRPTPAELVSVQSAGGDAAHAVGSSICWQSHLAFLTGLNNCSNESKSMLNGC
jgi:hypothetical protein